MPMARHEWVDLVNVRDRVTGKATLDRCLKEGLLHRAVAVLVIRKDGRFVLQRRSKSDLWHPGFWTISSTGHVKNGEGYFEAARRELSEELGLESRVHRFRKYLLPPFSSGGLTELEWVALFTCNTDSRCNIDPEEVESTDEFSPQELAKMIRTGPLTPDAKIMLADFLSRKRTK